MDLTLSMGLNANQLVGGFSLPTDLPNLKIWFKSDTGITKDGGNLVSNWADQSGNSNDLIQGTGTNQPLWVDAQLDGAPTIRTDGIDNFMKTASFTWNSPSTIYMVFKQVGWTHSKIVYDGDNGGDMYMQQINPTPNLQINSGVSLGSLSTFATGSFYISTAIYNGASSLFQNGDGTALTGDAGTDDNDGFTIGSWGTGATLWSNIDFVEIIGYNAAHTLSQRTSVKAYLATRYPSL